LLGDQIEEGEMDDKCDSKGEKKMHSEFRLENLKKRAHLKNLDVE
jgi:hypothetical protein